MSAGRLVSIGQVSLSAAVIVVAELAHGSLGARVVIGLAGAIFAVGVGRVIWEWRSEKAARARFDEEIGPWLLVPGPGA